MESREPSSDAPDELPGLWDEKPPDFSALDKHDLGAGSLADFSYTLYPRFRSVFIRLADSSPYGEEIAKVRALGAEFVDAFVERRRQEEERIDAPMPVRFWIGDELTGIVGYVPRGLEAPVDMCLGRLSDRGAGARIPAFIASTRYGLRVNLLIGSATWR
jgi:hypothetical protein